MPWGVRHWDSVASKIIQNLYTKHPSQAIFNPSQLFYEYNQSRASYAHGMVAIALFPGDSALLLLLLVVGAFVLLGMITNGLRMAMLFVGTVVA